MISSAFDPLPSKFLKEDKHVSYQNLYKKNNCSKTSLYDKKGYMSHFKNHQEISKRISKFSR
jgi:hypothetical protein